MTQVCKLRAALQDTEKSPEDAHSFISLSGLTRWQISGGAVQISSTSSCLLALGADGVVYRWPWELSAAGSDDNALSHYCPRPPGAVKRP